MLWVAITLSVPMLFISHLAFHLCYVGSLIRFMYSGYLIFRSNRILPAIYSPMFFTDPDSTYQPDEDPDADPDSDFLFDEDQDTDPDPTFHPDADPDPDPSFKKSAKIGSYSIHFGLTSANRSGSGSGSSL